MTLIFMDFDPVVGVEMDNEPEEWISEISMIFEDSEICVPFPESKYHYSDAFNEIHEWLSRFDTVTFITCLMKHQWFDGFVSEYRRFMRYSNCKRISINDNPLDLRSMIHIVGKTKLCKPLPLIKGINGNTLERVRSIKTCYDHMLTKCTIPQTYEEDNPYNKLSNDY